MTEAQKESKPKPAVRKPPSTEPDEQFQELERWIFYIAIAALLYFALMWLWGVLSGSSFFRTVARWPWSTILFGMKIGAVAFSVGGIYAIAKFVPKIMVLRAQLTMPPESALITKEEAISAEKEVVREAWFRIEAKLDLQNVSDWKLAVLEADALMDEVLQKRGLEGTTMGERLKSLGVAERLRSYEQLWDAHKLRNEIVHNAMREVSYEEVKRALDCFREAFAELGFSVVLFSGDSLEDAVK